MQFKAQDYRNILKELYAERCQRNPRYSLRAFARDIGLTSARCSEVLNYKDSLSKKSAERISVRLGFSDSEREFFCTLVESENGRSSRIRDLALKKLQKMEIKKDEERLKLDVFELISEWYHFAILELTLVRGFKSDLRWIARRLELSELEVKVAVERLLRLDLLRIKDAKWVAADSHTYAQSGIPSAAVRKYHMQVLDKAKAAIESQNVDEREIVTVVLATSFQKIPEAKAKIAAFQRDFSAAMTVPDEQRNELYYFSMQFFRAGGRA